jgi:hypothetical protein
MSDIEMVRKRIEEHKEHIGFWAEVGYRKWVRAQHEKGQI